MVSLDSLTSGTMVAKGIIWSAPGIFVNLRLSFSEEIVWPLRIRKGQYVDS